MIANRLHGKYSNYRYCVVQECKNTSLKTPGKLWIRVPREVKRRDAWLTAANRDPSSLSTETQMYICEDHFNLENDMINYMEYKIMGTVKRVRMKPGCVPSRFECQKAKEQVPVQNESELAHTLKKREMLPKQEDPLNTSTSLFIQGTMSEDAKETTPVKEEMSLECRACLQMFNSDSELYYIFQAWVPPWEGVDNTIAESLEKLGQIQVSDMDQHSKVICEVCCHKLHNAYLFMTLVQQSDHILKQRYASASPESRTSGADRTLDTRWPKPIQVDRIVPVEGTANFEIKQEALTDEETDYPAENVSQMAEMEIKVEPEEILPHKHSNVLNGHYGQLGSGDTTPDLPTLNGEDNSQDNYNMSIKEEPMSDSELTGTDMSLDCMLCTKVFNSVTGLKAHVIAQHSYKTVRRKAAHEVSPVKKNKNEYVCATCRRSFTTSTDLMVHETCHKKSVCYGCNAKFDTFELVTQHRLTCKAVMKREQAPIKTLEDVQRPPPAVDNKENHQDLLKCAHCDETFTDDYYMNIHLEVQHPGPRPALSEEEMEVDALESLFSERA